MSQRNQQTGLMPSRTIKAFTLVELLLAVVITALIAGTIHGMVRLAVKSQRSCEAEFTQQATLSSVCDLLTEDLRLIQPQVNQAQASFLGFRQKNDHGPFVLRMKLYARPTRQAKDLLVDYFLMPDANSQFRLIRRSCALPLGLPEEGEGWRVAQTESADYEVVARSIQSLEILFFDGQQWVSTWDSATKGTLPSLMELNWTFQPDNQEPVSLKQTYVVEIGSPILLSVQQEVFDR